jgi:hypothetical protein
MGRKPPNHGTYEIWYGGRTHAVDVQSVGVREVERMTRQPPGRWKDRPGVKVHVDNPRGTRPGDVIVDPTCGAWEVQRDCYMAVDPPGPVAERIRREGIVPEYVQLLKGWLGHMRESLTGEEITVAVQEPGEAATDAILEKRMRRLRTGADPERAKDRDLDR